VPGRRRPGPGLVWGRSGRRAGVCRHPARAWRGGHKRPAHCPRGRQGAPGAAGQRGRAGQPRHCRLAGPGRGAHRSHGQLHHDPRGAGGGSRQRRGPPFHRGPGRTGPPGGRAPWRRRLGRNRAPGRPQGRRQGACAAGRAHSRGRGHRVRRHGRGRIGHHRRIPAPGTPPGRDDPGRRPQLHRPGRGPGRQGGRGFDLRQGGQAHRRGRSRQTPGRADR